MIFHAEARCGTCWSASKINGTVSEAVVSRRLGGLLDTIAKYRPSALQRKGRRGKHSSHETSWIYSRTSDKAWGDTTRRRSSMLCPSR